jgi:hypothetical protein
LVTTFHKCSGTPLAGTPHFVTAAHCLKGDLLHVDYGDERFAITGGVAHEKFTSDAFEWDTRHDVAIVTVDGTFPKGPYSADTIGAGTDRELEVSGWKWQRGVRTAQTCAEIRENLTFTDTKIVAPRCGITEGGSGAGLLSGDDLRRLEGVLATVDETNTRNSFAPPQAVVEVLETL